MIKYSMKVRPLKKIKAGQLAETAKADALETLRLLRKGSVPTDKVCTRCPAT